MKSISNSSLDATIIDWPVHMQRAIDLAQRVRTATPNPRVGCVLVKGIEIIGEGWHVAAGEAHAEVVALGNAGKTNTCTEAFVSLEPCAHTGRTATCSEALIAAGVGKVIIASLDPNPLVAGKGVEQLEQAGVEVYQLVDFEEQSRAINPGYFKRREEGIPYVRLKLAMSLDGRAALANGQSKWITNEAARSDVQKLRASASAVITGINTVLADDPSLNVRSSELPENQDGLESGAKELAHQPIRAVVDSQLRTPGTAKIICNEGLVKIYSTADFTEGKNLADNVEIVKATVSGEGVDLQFVLESLASDFSCNDVLVEAGPTLSGAFIEAELVDELIVYIAPRLLGSDAKPLLEIHGLQSLAESHQFQVSQLDRIGDDIRVILKQAP